MDSKHKKSTNTVAYQGNFNLSPTGKILQYWQHQMLKRIWNNWNSHIMLLAMWNTILWTKSLAVNITNYVMISNSRPKYFHLYHSKGSTYIHKMTYLGTFMVDLFRRAQIWEKYHICYSLYIEFKSTICITPFIWNLRTYKTNLWWWKF